MSDPIEVEGAYDAKHVVRSDNGDQIGYVLELDNGKHILVHAPTDVVMDAVARAQSARMGGDS